VEGVPAHGRGGWNYMICKVPSNSNHLMIPFSQQQIDLLLFAGKTWIKILVLKKYSLLVFISGFQEDPELSNDSFF